MAARNYARKPLSEGRNWWFDGVTGSTLPGHTWRLDFRHRCAAAGTGIPLSQRS